MCEFFQLASHMHTQYTHTHAHTHHPHFSSFGRHTIESGVWGDNNLTYYEGRGRTIREALNFWYENRYNMEVGMVFRDICYGPRCNDGCPEELVLQEQGPKDWSTGVRIIIAIFVVAIAIICILLKVHICLLMWSSSFSITVSSG